MTLQARYKESLKASCCAPSVHSIWGGLLLNFTICTSEGPMQGSLFFSNKQKTNPGDNPVHRKLSHQLACLYVNHPPTLE